MKHLEELKLNEDINWDKYHKAKSELLKNPAMMQAYLAKKISLKLEELYNDKEFMNYLRTENIIEVSDIIHDVLSYKIKILPA